MHGTERSSQSSLVCSTDSGFSPFLRCVPPAGQICSLLVSCSFKKHVVKLPQLWLFYIYHHFAKVDSFWRGLAKKKSCVSCGPQTMTTLLGSVSNSSIGARKVSVETLYLHCNKKKTDYLDSYRQKPKPTQPNKLLHNNFNN